MAVPRIETFPDVGVTVVSSWIFNCYVVHDGGGGRPFIVDPGMVRNSDAALWFLREQLGLDPARPTEDGNRWVVAATHAHSDHVAGAGHLCSHAHAGLFLPEATRDWTDGFRPRSPGPRQAIRMAPVLRDQPFDLHGLKGFVTESKHAGYGAGPYRTPAGVVGYLGDGEAVPGAPDWMALHTPGHTDDATCFWRASTGTLLSGDTVLGLGGEAWFNPEFVDELASAATEARLRALGAELVLPGHGRAARGSDVLGSAIGHGERPEGEHTGLRRFFRRHARPATSRQ